MVANKFRNEVSAELNGRKYTLRPSFTCMLEIEEELKLTLSQIISLALQGKLTLKQMFFIVECGIKAAGAKFDKEELEDDITAAGVRYLLAMVDAFVSKAVDAGDLAKKNLVAEVTQAQ